LHIAGIKIHVDLGPAGPNSPAFTPVQNPELNTAGIGCQAHLTAKGVYLPYQVTLGKSPHSRIAAQRGYMIQVNGEQKTGHTHAGGCQGCLATGVTASGHYNLKSFRR
jgi:hypothetical protein